MNPYKFCDETKTNEGEDVRLKIKKDFRRVF